MAERMTGGQAVVRALAEHGVEVAFGIPGVHTLAIYDALIDSPIRHILGRHEQGVGFMADGYARASGKPGVAHGDHRPGRDQRRHRRRRGLHRLLAGAGRRLGRGSALGRQDDGALPRHPRPDRGHPPGDRLPGAGDRGRRSGPGHRRRLRTAWRPHARVRSTSRSRATCWTEAEITFPDPVLADRPGPTAEQIAGAVEEIAKAKRVVIIAGGGAATRDASPASTAIAERLGAPVIVSQMGKGVIPEDHPYAVGALWAQGNAVDALLRKADAVLVFGTKLGAHETEDGAMRLPARMIRVDIDPEEVERNYRPSRGIVADARKTA